MLLRFTKMHGLGNDFMVLDLVSQHAHILPKHAKLWGDRHTGVGFDQLLLVEAPSNPEVDFRYRIFNSDGSEVEQCGNGARCFARFVLDKRLTAKRQIRVETKSGIIELDIRSDGQISVNMGAPRLVPADIPFQADAQALSYPVEVDGKTVELAAVSMGNPMPCCGSTTSTTRRSMNWGRRSNTTRAFRHGSTSGSYRSSTVLVRNCASGSAVPGKPKRAALVLAPLPWRRSARGGWIRRY